MGPDARNQDGDPPRMHFRSCSPSGLAALGQPGATGTVRLMIFFELADIERMSRQRQESQMAPGQAHEEAGPEIPGLQRLRAQNLAAGTTSKVMPAAPSTPIQTTY